MPGVTKGHPYLNKPVAFSCRFVQVRITFCQHQVFKVLIEN